MRVQKMLHFWKGEELQRALLMARALRFEPWNKDSVNFSHFYTFCSPALDVRHLLDLTAILTFYPKVDIFASFRVLFSVSIKQQPFAEPRRGSENF